MARWTRVFTALLAAALIPALAGAATLTPLSQTRFVALEDIPRATSVREDAADFADFDASLADGLVAQSSSLAANRILATTQHDAATGDLGPTGEALAHFVVESFFSVSFELDQATAYTFEAQIAELDAVTDLAEVFPWWDLQIRLETSLVGPLGEVVGFSFDLQADCGFQESCEFATPLSAAGNLGAGHYTLTAHSFAELDRDTICVGFLCGGANVIGSSSAGRVSVDLQIVPEVSPLLGVTLGLITLALGRRARNATSAKTERLFLQ